MCGVNLVRLSGRSIWFRNQNSIDGWATSDGCGFFYGVEFWVQLLITK
jgi:hypothetical protein